MYRDLRFHIGYFREVLAELGEEDLARRQPWIDAESQSGKR